MPPDVNFHELIIPLKDSEDVYGIIKKVAELSNRLGLDRKPVRDIQIKKLFGEGIKITLEVDNKWFKII